MPLTAVRFASLVFAALALAPALTHVMELGHKINMSHDEYLTVQQIYRGWAWLGIVVFGALLSTLALAIRVRKHRPEFVPALVAFLCVVGTQVVFWTLTFPVNKATSNWTVMPENWAALRSQWEYSHAIGALLALAAFVALAISVLSGRK